MDSLKVPFYAKISLILIGLCAFICILYVAQGIILPVIFATIIAIAITPFMDWCLRHKMNRIIAISVSVVFMCLISGLAVALIGAQLRSFVDSGPNLLDKFYETLNRSTSWAVKYFHVTPKKINLYMDQTKTEILQSGKNILGAVVMSMGSFLAILVLIPVYVFMILFYRPLLMEFIQRLFKVTDREEVNQVLHSIKTIIQKYLAALLIEAAIIAALNSIGFLTIGIDYAIALGVIAAVLNIIPYIGGIVAVSLPMMVAFITKPSPTAVFLVLFVYIIIQFIDNHYIIPKIVASKVKINALIAIIVVFAGGTLWGIPGMFLSIPLTAILKVIFDHINGLEPWGFLLGDTMPSIAIFKIRKPRTSKALKVSGAERKITRMKVPKPSK